MQLVVGAEAAVLNDQREIVLVAGQVQGALFLVADDQQTRQPAVHLGARQAMRMRVEPVGAGAVGDLELVDNLPARRHRETRVAVHGLGHQHAVPVHHTGLGQLVDEMDAHAHAAAHPDDGAQVAVGQCGDRTGIALDHLGVVAPDPRGRPTENAYLVGRGAQRQLKIGDEAGAAALRCVCQRRHGTQQSRGARAAQKLPAARGVEGMHLWCSHPAQTALGAR